MRRTVPLEAARTRLPAAGQPRPVGHRRITDAHVSE
jgi:hypothetical protein